MSWLVDWLQWGLGPHGPNAARPSLTGPFCPISIHGSPIILLKFQMAPKLILLMSSGSKKKQPRYTCLSEAKDSHSQRMWAEVSSSAPHLLHSGLSSSPSRWRCLLRVLSPGRRPVTALDCVLLKDRNLALAPRQGPEIISWACLWVWPRLRSRHSYFAPRETDLGTHLVGGCVHPTATVETICIHRTALPANDNNSYCVYTSLEAFTVTGFS
jgi:hypothetical protein